MKNTIASILIFLAVLGVVTYFNSSLTKLCNKIQTDTKTIHSSIENENWEDAYSESEKLSKTINKHAFVLSMYVNHRDFDDILDESIELCLYVQNKDPTESLIALYTLKNSANNIQKLHKPTIENIF